jgi:hypothetical protein
MPQSLSMHSQENHQMATNKGWTIKPNLSKQETKRTEPVIDSLFRTAFFTNVHSNKANKKKFVVIIMYHVGKSNTENPWKKQIEKMGFQTLGEG